MRAVPYFLPVRAAPKKPKNCRAEMRAMTKSRLQQCSTAEPAQGLVRDRACQSLGTDEASQALAAAAEMQPRDPPAGGMSQPDLPSGSLSGLAATAVACNRPSPWAETPPKRCRRGKVDRPLRYQDSAD
jgi:hypothetical protein